MPLGNRELLTPPPFSEEAEDGEEESTPRLIDGSSPQEPEFTGVLGPHTSEGLSSKVELMIKSHFLNAPNCPLGPCKKLSKENILE